jgi:hypothetical protein
MNWPLAKEVCGFVGTLLVLVPWLRDFRGRRLLERTRDTRTLGSLSVVKAEAIAQHRHWLDRPKPGDLVATIVGFLLIAASFVIGVALTWQPVAAPAVASNADAR